MTLLLTRFDLLAVLDPDTCLDALHSAFLAADPAAPSGHRLVAELPFPGRATGLIPGLLPGVGAYTVKVNAKFPSARPALRADPTRTATLLGAPSRVARLRASLLLRPRPGRPALAGPRTLLVRLHSRDSPRRRHAGRDPRMTAGGGLAERSETRFRLRAPVV